jgi:hypothetical protein
MRLDHINDFPAGPARRQAIPPVEYDVVDLVGEFVASYRDGIGDASQYATEKLDLCVPVQTDVRQPLATLTEEGVHELLPMRQFSGFDTLVNGVVHGAKVLAEFLATLKIGRGVG